MTAGYTTNTLFGSSVACYVGCTQGPSLCTFARRHLYIGEWCMCSPTIDHYIPCSLNAISSWLDIDLYIHIYTHIHIYPPPLVHRPPPGQKRSFTGWWTKGGGMYICVYMYISLYLKDLLNSLLLYHPKTPQYQKPTLDPLVWCPNIKPGGFIWGRKSTYRPGTIIF